MRKNWTEKIESEIQTAVRISHSYKPAESVIRILGNKIIYLKTDLDVCANGSPRAREIDEFGRVETALSWDNGWNGGEKFVNSEKIPYVILPGKFNLVCGVSCKLGDLASVRHGQNEIFAIYADVGPIGKIGEGSVALVEALGANPWNRMKTNIDSTIVFGVETLILPRSSEKFGIPMTFQEIQTLGQRAFDSVFDAIGKTERLSMTVSKIQ